MKKIYVLLFSLIFLAGCDNSEKENKKEFGCSNVTDCLGKNMFQEAILLAEKGYDPGEKKLEIYTEELKYWLKQNDLERAITAWKQIRTLPTDFRSGLSQRAKDERLYLEVMEIMQAYCRTSQLEESAEFIEILDDRVEMYEEQKFIKTKRQYLEIKKELPLDKRIEPFKDEHEYHDIFQVILPKKKAEQLLNECTKRKK